MGKLSFISTALLTVSLSVMVISPILRPVSDVYMRVLGIVALLSSPLAVLRFLRK